MLLMTCLTFSAVAREWTDASGHYKFKGELVAGNETMVVLEKGNKDLVSIDIEQLSVDALATAKLSANPKRDLEAGRYKVILGPECLSTMLNFLSWLGFSGKDYLDGSSFLTGKMGQPVIGCIDRRRLVGPRRR